MKLYLTSVASQSLDKIVQELPQKPAELKVLFIPTAADTYAKDNRPWFDADRDKFIELGFKLEDFDLKGKSEDEVRAALSKTDIIFVSGGNTFYLLEHVKKSGFDKVLRELKDSDKIYIGSSAGSIILGPNIEPIKSFDDPSAAKLDNYDGIGLVDFVVLPHWGKEKYAARQEKVIKEFDKKYKLKPIKDGEMITVQVLRRY